ncbi:stage III sporulation protein AF [Sinanaerobacter chloroacetimidivorans]|jgi:stage III sporulation protein AF|uniref:Stage III sporulation protein AF n=1 Tax=Sinanaerobacter chloroacetimidivorans TaxID=2818044 RepID=A0A8J7VZY0_9FIRM|nr:stage III sporulation protein AF [Sinanaerobacter chloroacetimidivorans]MBR0596626.1 stage III sporulation protein AF [Sinanaerobacter chloroacetimidivorans]
MEIAREWVKNIFIIIVAISFVEILLPAGAMKKYLKFIFSLVIMAIILSPLAILME